MAYKKIKSYNLTEQELRELWSETYCKAPITTFDNIQVKFFDDMFDHAFFESDNRKEKDKSINQTKQGSLLLIKLMTMKT